MLNMGFITVIHLEYVFTHIWSQSHYGTIPTDKPTYDATIQQYKQVLVISLLILS